MTLYVVNTMNDLMRLDIKENDVVETLGFYVVGDGGNAKYLIQSKDNFGIPLESGLYANLLLDSNKVNVKTIGLRYDSNKYKEENSKILEEYLIKYGSQYIYYFPKGSVFLGDIHFENAPKNYSPYIKICGDGNMGNTNSLSIIKTEGSDLFYDTRETTENMWFLADDIVIRTQDWLVSEWIPKGICYGLRQTSRNSEVNFRFNNVNIEGFKYGVYAPNYACGGSGGRNFAFAFCRHGIYIKDATHCFNAINVSCNYCADGINLGVGGEGNLIRNFHSATGYLGEDKNEIDHFTSIYTRGGLTIDGLYFEPYESSAQTGKHIIIDYEPFVSTWGGKPLILRNTNAGSPGAGYSGLFMRIGCYLGASPGRPNGQGYTVIPPLSDHYKFGILEWVESKKLSKDSFKKLIQFSTKEEGRILFIGNSIKGDCVPEIYDEDIIMNKHNFIYVNTQQGKNYESAKKEYIFNYNQIQKYCPNHLINKDRVSQTLHYLIQDNDSVIYIKGRVEIERIENREFDIFIKVGDYKYYVGSYPSTNKNIEVFEFDLELPKHLQTKFNANKEPMIMFKGEIDKTYNPRTDYDKVKFYYKVGVDK